MGLSHFVPTGFDVRFGQTHHDQEGLAGPAGRHPDHRTDQQADGGKGVTEVVVGWTGRMPAWMGGPERRLVRLCLTVLYYDEADGSVRPDTPVPVGGAAGPRRFMGATTVRGRTCSMAHEPPPPFMVCHHTRNTPIHSPPLPPASYLEQPQGIKGGWYQPAAGCPPCLTR